MREPWLASVHFVCLRWSSGVGGCIVVMVVLFGGVVCCSETMHCHATVNASCAEER